MHLNYHDSIVLRAVLMPMKPAQACCKTGKPVELQIDTPR